MENISHFEMTTFFFFCLNLKNNEHAFVIKGYFTQFCIPIYIVEIVLKCVSRV